MAYIQDISVLMRELLKVPRDYTPTAIEISKYIRSRYCNDQIEKSRASKPLGSRGFSSASRSVPPRLEDHSKPPQDLRQPQPLHLVNRRQKMSGRSLTYSTFLRAKEKAKQQELFPKMNPRMLEKRNLTATMTKKNLYKEKVQHKIQHKDVWDQKPMTAPVKIAPKPNPQPSMSNRPSFWNWQSAKNHIRRAMSDLVVSPSAPKTKLAMLSEKVTLDPKVEQALEAKRKGMLKDMVDPDISDREPVRTREIIQRLLEENKLEDQRREIARLTELARSKVMEARKSNFSKKARIRRHEEDL